MKRITYEGFYDPPKKYTMVPFWFWNDGLDENSLAEQLSAMHEKGVFECIIHARKGLEVEYLSDDWFKRIRSVAGRARSLGMKQLAERICRRACRRQGAILCGALSFRRKDISRPGRRYNRKRHSG